MKVRLSILPVVVFMLLSRTAQAQVIVSPEGRQYLDSITLQRNPYRLMVTMGGGLSYYYPAIRIPAAVAQPQQNRFGVPATLRVMWYPDHRLRAGIETGRVTLYNYRGQTSGEPTRVYVSMVPILAVFSMPLSWLKGGKNSLARRLSILAGAGTFINTSRLEYVGTVQTKRNSLGWMVAGAYTQPLSSRLSIAGEVKWLDAVSVQNEAFTAQLQVVWQAFSW